MRRSRWIIALAVPITTAIMVLVFVGGDRSLAKAKRGQRGTPSKAAQLDQNQSIEQQRLDLDRQKHSDDLALQRDDVALKKQQLEIQRSQIWGTVLSTVIPLLAVLFTIFYNALIFRRQTRQVNEQRREDADLQFQLKAAEIAFNGEAPLEVQDRARVLKKIFPTRLSNSLLVDYDPSEFGEREGKLDSKKFLLELLLKYPTPEQQFETLCFWKEIFPGDVKWLRRVNLSPHNPPTKRAGTAPTDVNAQAPTGDSG